MVYRVFLATNHCSNITSSLQTTVGYSSATTMNRGAPFTAVTLLCFLSFLASCSTATRPVILVHGLTFHHLEGMQKLYNTIREELPGTDVYLVKTHADETSLTTPMWTQVNETYKEIEQRLQSAGSDGVTFICYSQGKDN